MAGGIERRGSWPIQDVAIGTFLRLDIVGEVVAGKRDNTERISRSYITEYLLSDMIEL